VRRECIALLSRPFRLRRHPSTVIPSEVEGSLATRRLARNERLHVGLLASNPALQCCGNYFRSEISRLRSR